MTSYNTMIDQLKVSQHVIFYFLNKKLNQPRHNDVIIEQNQRLLILSCTIINLMQKCAIKLAVLLIFCLFSFVKSAQIGDQVKNTKYVSTPLTIVKFITGAIKTIPFNATAINVYLMDNRDFIQKMLQNKQAQQKFSQFFTVAVKATKAHPYVAAGLGVAALLSSSASYIYNTYSYGVATGYLLTNALFREKIEIANFITQIELYKSPIEQSIFEHYQIIFQIDKLIWALVSWGKDGLEVAASLTKQALVNRRAINSRADHKQVKTPTKRLQDFIKLYQEQKYHFIEWNCQDYSYALWNMIIQ